jgi:excisionase family DNA binding protein
MKKRGGVRKGGGRPRGSKNLKSAADVEDREVMTLQDVADYLHCHYTSAHRLARRGDIPSFRLGGLGGSWRFLKSEIDQWIAKGGGRQPSEEPAVKPEGGAHKRKPRPRSR